MGISNYRTTGHSHKYREVRDTVMQSFADQTACEEHVCSWKCELSAVFLSRT